MLDLARSSLAGRTSQSDRAIAPALSGSYELELLPLDPRSLEGAEPVQDPFRRRRTWEGQPRRALVGLPSAPLSPHILRGREVRAQAPNKSEGIA